jgi:hypothetical protein
MTRLPHYAAMLATAGELPVDDDRWYAEMKWDGVLSELSNLGEDENVRAATNHRADAARVSPRPIT